MKIEFGYGNSVQMAEIPDRNLMAVLESNPFQHERRGRQAVEYALDNPIGAPLLENLVRKGQKIVIVTSDISRPMPSYEVLPGVLDRLYKAGISRQDITVVLALGSHRRHTEEEKRKLVGERCYQEVKCVDSDIEDCVFLRETKNRTPVEITREVVEADFRICLGNIEFHYFAGYSGGAKAIMPGVASYNAIQMNHRLMIQESSCAGRLEGNLLREDIEEAGNIVGIDYIVNVVLDEHKKIVYCTAGDVTEAHRDGCRYLDKMYRKVISSRADIVMVSQGGAPKDANLYQVQKALNNAKHAVKKGGRIILIGACQEGTGSKKFEEWLLEADTPHSMIERIGEHFELGGHKAVAIGMILENAQIDLVSEMPEAFVRHIFMNPQPSAQKALDEALEKYGENAKVLAMPYGGSTLPVVL